MKQNKGFSLVELLVTVIIVGILSFVAVGVYRNHVKRSMEMEALTMLGEVNAAQQVYYARNKALKADIDTLTSSVPELGLNFSRNRYYTGIMSYNFTNPVAKSGFNASGRGYWCYMKTNEFNGLSYAVLVYTTFQPIMYRYQGTSRSQLTKL